MDESSRSADLFSRALKHIPGGVNSPVRAYGSVGMQPLFIRQGQGAYIYDEDGKRFIDYVLSWGPLILGHRPAPVLAAIEKVLARGMSFGAPTDLEVEFAELVSHLMPSLESVRLVNSGTEATMSALRLARAYTRRDYFVKFEGCYHGHGDCFLSRSGSGMATLGIPASPGVPRAAAELALTTPFNDLERFSALLKKTGGEKIAAVIVEPVAGNMGLVLPQPGFLQGLREQCDRYGILLVFDEVMTGFRVALGGAQALFGVRPDLTTLGKVIGGGLPVGAFGGRAEIMNQVAPAGPVYQAGTLSGNPLAVAAGLAQLKYLKENNPYAKFETLTAALTEGLEREASANGVPFQSAHCGSMFGFYFSEEPVVNFAQALKSDTKRFKKFFRHMLASGIYLAPSPFEAGFVCTEHTQEMLQATVSAAGRAIGERD